MQEFVIRMPAIDSYPIQHFPRMNPHLKAQQPCPIQLQLITQIESIAHTPFFLHFYSRMETLFRLGVQCVSLWIRQSLWVLMVDSSVTPPS
mmetsp:Transcript_2957/g.11294  ORF Transcript_2957/g.11294 Transcript_2957/m.11294 type:complete len:91 (+) Transcript_2957:2280-2552(+)